MARVGSISPDIKKKTRVAEEADPKERTEFQNKQGALPVEQLIFIDEFGMHLAMTRSRARSLQGKRAIVREPFRNGINISVIGGLRLDGFYAPMTLEGPMDSAAFDLYVEHFLVPELRSGDIVIMDNVPFHHSERAAELIEGVGARIEHLPSYSPDFNPIEHCISKLKAALRKAKARTKRKLLNALARAISWIKKSDIIGWFAHCGYSCPPN